MNNHFSPGDVITPAPGCDWNWYEPRHPLLIIVSATSLRGDSRAPPCPRIATAWWQVTTTPPLASLSDIDPYLPRGLILDVHWTILGHQDE